MQDLTTTFTTLAQRKRSRWSAETEALVRKVGETLRGRVEWDSGAGEDWATIVNEPPGSGALVYAQAPLVICADADAVRGAVPVGVAVVEVADRDSDDLQADRTALVELFGTDSLAGEFDPERFSANDLWFWTI